jgi:hypothetical protein
MAYLDTNVIIAYCFPRDNNHRNAKSLITKLQELGVKELYHSPLTLVELYSYVSRNADILNIPEELRELIRTKEQRVRVIAEYCLSSLSSLTTSVFISDTEGLINLIINNLPNVRIFHKFAEALRLAPELQLPSLDLLHVIYAKQVPERIKYFATLDKAIIGKAESIRNALGIEVITAPSQGFEETRQQK